MSMLFAESKDAGTVEDCISSEMAANIELIFRDFVMNKIKEIEDEDQNSCLTNSGVPRPVAVAAQGSGQTVPDGMERLGENRSDPAPSETTENPKNVLPESVSENLDSERGLAGKEESETTRKKNKKHKRHKSKKKKKKRKEEKGSSSESDLESDGEIRNQSSEKTDIGANSEVMDGDQAGAMEKVSRTQLLGEAGEERTKKEKRHVSKKKKKKKSRKRDEEKKGRKSQPDSPVGGTSVSGTESEMEGRTKSKTSPEVSSDKPKEWSSSVSCPGAQGAVAAPLADIVTTKNERMSGEELAVREDCLTIEGVTAEHKDNQETLCKTGELPDIIPKLESAYAEGLTKEDVGVSKEMDKQQDTQDQLSKNLMELPPQKIKSKRIRKRSSSADKSKRSKSRSPARRRRSRSRRSRSGSRRRRSGFPLDRRDRWKRTPSHSPILILRKKRSPRRSPSKTPPRLTELDKDQLLEIAKANAAAMCVKAGMPIPESLMPKSLGLPLNIPLNLPMAMSNMPNIAMNATVASVNAALSTMNALTTMSALPSITNKPPTSGSANTANIEEAKKKVAQTANSISIKEFTEKCKKIAESTEEMAIAKPHVSDDEDDEKPFAGAGLKENKGITFSLGNPTAKPAGKTEAAFAKEFPVSSGSQHRKKEGDGAYGEWVPVDKKTEKTPATPTAVTEEASTESDSVFPEAPLQPVDITLAVSERAAAQKRLAENPFDVSAMCMLSRAQEQVDAWAQSNTIPGLFTGSTGAQVLSSEELSTGGPQAWIKKDQFLRAAPVSGGMGELLMRKMGWREGEGLGKRREGTVEPIVIDFKTDRKGLVAEGEKTQKSGNLVVMKDLLGKHPVSALMEMCNKKKWAPPDFVMVHDSGPDHRKNFLFKVVVNGSEYQPQTASPNKKHAKAMAATVALQAMGEVSGENSSHSGPVFTAATTTG
ncbi:hypothetical protein GJAV_G00210550 [Gymnothorax javanicus]|nr:hypothetical protein GJAV_G00210550 [Gymnothorax javanicus]